MGRGRDQVIELRLNRAEETFALAQTDLFSEYRNYLTGVEYCISASACSAHGARGRPLAPQLQALINSVGAGCGLHLYIRD